MNMEGSNKEEEDGVGGGENTLWSGGTNVCL